MRTALQPHGRVRQAARRRPHRDLRAADVRHRRRRDAADPAHRHHAAVRELRRVEPGQRTSSSWRCWCGCRPARRPPAEPGSSRAPRPAGGRVDGHASAGSAIALTGLFLLLFAQVSYLQVVRGRPRSRTTPRTHRQIIAEYKVFRGPILATTAGPCWPSAGRRPGRARLPAAVPGRRAVRGRDRLLLAGVRPDGARAAMNPYLNGDAAGARRADVRGPRAGPAEAGRDRRHDDRRRSCRQAAARALGIAARRRRRDRPVDGRRAGDGVEPLVRPEPAVAAARRSQITAQWDKLNADPAHPLLSNANDQLYPPGSTFKIITATRRWRTARRLETTYPNPHELDLPLSNGDAAELRRRALRRRRARRSRSLTRSQISCNVMFGEIGLQLGADKLPGAGAGVRLLPDRPAEADRLHRADDPVHDPVPDRAVPRAGVLRAERPAGRHQRDRPGQRPGEPDADGAGGRHRSRTAATMMQPQLVQEIRDPQGRVVETLRPAGVRAADLGRDREGADTDDGERTSPGGTAYPYAKSRA